MATHRRSPLTKQIRIIRKSISTIERALKHLTPVLRKAATPARGRPRKLRLSPKRRAALKLQGTYLGYMRQLKPRQKARAKAVKETKGFEAAIRVEGELSRRDPGNAEIQSVLGWSYDNAGETLFWFARANRNSDQARQAQERLERAHEIRELLAENKKLWTEDQIHTNANLAAAKGVLAEINKDFAAAAGHFVEAAEGATKVAVANKRDDSLLRAVTMREWAADAYQEIDDRVKARGQIEAALTLIGAHSKALNQGAIDLRRRRLEEVLKQLR